MLQLRDPRYEHVRLVFEPEAHKYNDTFGNDYISTTTILGKYKPAFDRSYWLKKKSKELGVSQKVLANQWQTITDEACARGSVTHDAIENGVRGASMFKSAVRHLNATRGEMITVADIPNIHMNVRPLCLQDFKEATENKYEDIYKVFQYYIDRDYKIYAELGTFLIDYLVSGMIDILIVREDQFVIGDWKTNRGGLKFESGYYKKDKKQSPAQHTNEWVSKKEFLNPPLGHLMNCNGMLYNLQLSFYAKQVELILGIPNAGLWLCHIDSDFVLNEYGQPKRFPDGLYHIKDNPVETTTFHKMTYLKKEVETILNDRLREVDATRVRSRSLFDMQ